MTSPTPFTLVCAECGKTFEAERPARTCSNACRQRAYRRRRRQRERRRRERAS